MTSGGAGGGTTVKMVDFKALKTVAGKIDKEP